MYAFFLLALLADVARAQVYLPAGGATGTAGSIESAAGSLGSGGGGKALELPRGASRSSSIAVRGSGRGWTLSGWTRLLSSRTRLTNLGGLALLAALVSAPVDGSGSAPVRAFVSAPQALAIFAHTGSPAP